MLSERLKQAMHDADISQAELARACKVKPPSIHGWLSGKSKFLRGENLLLAASALKVSQQWLATGDGNKHIDKQNPGESELLAIYRSMQEREQQTLLRMAQALNVLAIGNTPSNNGVGQTPLDIKSSAIPARFDVGSTDLKATVTNERYRTK